MRKERRAVDIGNRTYQGKIANNLVHSLGLDGAIDACVRNDWPGTLNVILKEERCSR